MREFIEVLLADEPGIHVTTGRGEVFHFIDGDNAPEVTGLAAAVLAARLRWWADFLTTPPIDGAKTARCTCGSFLRGIHRGDCQIYATTPPTDAAEAAGDEDR